MANTVAESMKRIACFITLSSMDTNIAKAVTTFYRLSKRIRMLRVKYFICPHHHHQIFGIAQVDNVVSILPFGDFRIAGVDGDLSVVSGL
jgi:hypothetical protein